MAKLRMGYVGCGALAQRVHIPNLLAMDDVEFVGVAEVRPKLGRAVAEKFHIATLYADHRELAADESIQAVAVSGHHVGQGRIAMDLLAAGKDVFMEKPMAVSVAGAERLLDAQRDSGRRLMVGYMKRYDKGNVLVRRLIDEFRASGELGELQYVRNHGFCGSWLAGAGPVLQSDEPYPPGPTDKPEWMAEEFYDSYTNYLQQYTHNVNLVRWLLDAGDDARVKAVDLDDDGTTGLVVLEVAGVRTVIESASSAYHGWEEHTTVYFKRGWIYTHAPALLIRGAPATVEVYRADEGKPVSEARLFPTDGWSWSFAEEMGHFVACVAGGQPFRSPADDALVDVRLLEDIYRLHTQPRPSEGATS